MKVFSTEKLTEMAMGHEGTIQEHETSIQEHGTAIQEHEASIQANQQGLEDLAQSVEELEQECSAISEQCDDGFALLEEKVETKFKEWSELNKKSINKLKGTLSNLSDKIKTVNKKHVFNTCIFLCAILLFDIIAIWFILFRPAISSSLDTSQLPWFYILSLIAYMMLNIVGVVIFWYHVIHSEYRFNSWDILGIIVEGLALFMNVIVMFVFAFIPFEDGMWAAVLCVIWLSVSNLIMSTNQWQAIAKAGFTKLSVSNLIMSTNQWQAIAKAGFTKKWAVLLIAEMVLYLVSLVILIIACAIV